MQNHYNLIYREEEREMMALCQSEGIGVIPWSPLARGKITRPYSDPGTGRSATDEYGKTLYTKSEDSDRMVIDRVGEIAAKRGVPRAQIGIAWMLSKPFITAVNSIRLFVVDSSPSNNSLSYLPLLKIAAHPPGPGFGDQFARHVGRLRPVQE